MKSSSDSKVLSCKRREKGDEICWPGSIPDAIHLLFSLFPFFFSFFLCSCPPWHADARVRAALPYNNSLPFCWITSRNNWGDLTFCVVVIFLVVVFFPPFFSGLLILKRLLDPILQTVVYIDEKGPPSRVVFFDNSARLLFALVSGSITRFPQSTYQSAKTKNTRSSASLSLYSLSCFALEINQHEAAVDPPPPPYPSYRFAPQNVTGYKENKPPKPQTKPLWD